MTYIIRHKKTGEVKTIVVKPMFLNMNGEPI